MDSSGLQMAGGARLLNERSTSSPPLNRAANETKKFRTLDIVYWISSLFELFVTFSYIPQKFAIIFDYFFIL